MDPPTIALGSAARGLSLTPTPPAWGQRSPPSSPPHTHQAPLL